MVERLVLNLSIILIYKDNLYYSLFLDFVEKLQWQWICE